MKKIFIIVLMFASLLVQAQDNPIKDTQLKRLIGLAVGNFPRIKELQEQAKQFAIRDELARSGYKPTVTGNASYAYIAPLPFIDFGAGKLYFAPNNNYNASVTINQLIYDFGRIRLQLDRNKAESSVLDATIDNSRNTVAYQVSQIYYTILFLYKAIATQREQITALQSNEKIIQAKLDNGDALRYDLLTTQVRTSNSTNRLEDLQSQLAKQYVMLQWLTGSDAKSKLDSTGQYDPLSLVIAGDSTASNNLEIQALQKRIDVLKFDIKSADINEKPTLFSSATGGAKNGYQPNIDPLKLNGSVAVGVTVPIFNGGRPKLQQKLAQVQVDVTKASINTLQTTIQKDLQVIAEDFKLLTQKLKNTDIIVAQAERAFEIGNVRFKNGLITNAELLLVQTSVEDAKLQQVQLQYQIQIDRLESHRIIGNRIY